MGKKEKSLMRQLIEERGIKDMDGVYALVKEMTAGLIQECLDPELEEELGYSRYDYKNKQTDNSRNGSYKKTVSSSQEEIDLKVPRDRNGDYEPQIVKKHQMGVSEIEDKILFLYSQGTSTRDIERTMQEMYGIEVDATRVSKITDKILPVIREWRTGRWKAYMPWSCWMRSTTRCAKTGAWSRKPYTLALAPTSKGKRTSLAYGSVRRKAQNTG